ncbi:MAG: hypothetical protein JW774_02710 [Candidatus Aureabacteria bacterium]|nr:hypothetical protein [Candidatus Auribacterota bacterium]
MNSNRTLSERVEVKLFLLLFITFIYFYNGSGWNADSRMAQIYRVVEQGKWDITPFLNKTKDISIKGDRIYPNKPPGSSLLGIIPYSLIYYLQKTAGFIPAVHPELVLLNAYLVNVFSSNLLSALACLYFFRLCFLVSGTVFPSLLLTVSLGLGTLFFPYNSVFLGHTQAVSLFIIGFYFAFRSFFMDDPGSPSGSGPFLTGLFLGLSVVVDFFMIYLFLPLVIYLFLSGKKKVLFLTAGLIIPFLILTVYQSAVFGGPFETPMRYNNPIFSYNRTDLFLGVFQRPNWTIMKELFLGEYYGFFTFNPVLFFGIIGMGFCFRIGKYQQLSVIAFVQTILTFVSNAAFIGWWGGQTAGPRYLSGCIPILLFSALPCFKYRWLPYVFIPVLCLSLYFNLAVTATTPIPGKLTSLREKIIPAFQEKRFALSKEYPRMMNEDVPHSLLKYSSFNLGQMMGLSSSKSLWPLYGLQLLFLFLILKIIRQSLLQKSPHDE